MELSQFVLAEDLPQHPYSAMNFVQVESRACVTNHNVYAKRLELVNAALNM